MKFSFIGSSMSHAFDVSVSESHPPTRGHLDFFPMLPAGGFIVLRFTFRSKIRFELIFAKSARSVSMARLFRLFCTWLSSSVSAVACRDGLRSSVPGQRQTRVVCAWTRCPTPRAVRSFPSVTRLPSASYQVCSWVALGLQLRPSPSMCCWPFWVLCLSVQTLESVRCCPPGNLLGFRFASWGIWRSSRSGLPSRQYCVFLPPSSEQRTSLRLFSSF